MDKANHEELQVRKRIA